MQTIAAVAYPREEGFRVQPVSLDALRNDEILVKIAGVGLCHTDLVFKTGAGDYPLPAVLGHEGSGIVAAVGSSVSKVKNGDHVVMTFRSCGTCDRCEAGDAAYCRTMPMLNYAGVRCDGTKAITDDNGGSISSNFFGQSSFAGHAITYERNVVKIDDDLPLEIMGPLGCGIQTGVGSIIRSLKVYAGSTVVISGAGPVGLSATMGAVIAGCRRILLVEPIASRRELGTELGATHVIDPAACKDLTAAIRDVVAAGADFALDTTGIPEVQSALLMGLGSKGILGIVGISVPGTAPPGDLNNIMTFGQTIRGVIEGDSNPDEFIPELIEHYKAGNLPFDRLIKTFPLSEINQAIAKQHAGDCVKAVLLPGDQDPV